MTTNDEEPTIEPVRRLLRDYRAPRRAGDPCRRLVLVVHHGLRTRLLDWSTSPLAALYFAIEGEVELNLERAFNPACTGKATFFVLTYKAGYIDVDAAPPPFELKEVGLFYPRHVTARRRIQAGR